MSQFIIDNRVGEPDLKFIPPHILPRQLPFEFYADNKLGYDLDRRGMRRTLEAIANNFNQKNKSDITQENIVLTSGARAAASSAILRIIGNVRRREMDIKPRVLLLQPGYNLYETQFEGFGFKLDFVKPTAEMNEREKLELIKSRLTHETLILPICNPNNPTGEIYSESFVKGLIALLHEFPNLHIINDSIYDCITRSPETHVPNIFALASKEERVRIFEINALSKAYSYPAIRAGWLIGDAGEIAAIQIYKDAQFGPLNNIGQLVTIAALEQTPIRIPHYFAEINAIYNKRLNLVDQKLHQITGFNSQIPEGTFYYWADFTAMPEMAARLEKRRIAVSEGKKFGDPGFIRINCGASAAELAVLCDNMVDIAREKGFEIIENKVILPTPDADIPEFAKERGR